MEEVDSISVAVSGIDINKVEPLDTRRIVAFINHFLCTSVTFLNQFASKCETKLEGLQHKIHRLESQLKILECKLASIPPQQLSTVPAASVPQSQPQTSSKDHVNEGHPPPPPPLPSDDKTTDEDDRESIPDSEEGFKGQSSSLSDVGIPGSEPEGDKSNANPRDDPLYSKYFKMASVGVPVPAIKIKMASEGVDPSVLDL